MTKTLKGKKILIVDDEPDVLEALSELLDMCEIDYARNFETAEKLRRAKNCLTKILTMQQFWILWG
jgi:response regulator RpfG family c-di-GMP phosphodiesterase